jgi:hypothetical protein
VQQVDEVDKVLGDAVATEWAKVIQNIVTTTKE